MVVKIGLQLEKFQHKIEQNYKFESMKDKAAIMGNLNREEPSVTIAQIKQMIDAISPLHCSSIKLSSSQTPSSLSKNTHEVLWICAT